MSPAAAHPAPTASALTAQRGGLAPTAFKMNFYDLQNRFWQLDAIERFSGNETRLYFYWLNRFNAEFWPVQLTRWGTQVEADLGLTDKTLAAARKTLVSRGLLTYQEGTRAKAANWGLSGIIPDDESRNNSGQSPIIRNYSGQSEAIPPQEARNNSGQSAAIIRKNSGLYKDYSSSKDQDLPPDDAASAAAPREEKKLAGSASSEKPNASASHTEGGAADVATSVPGIDPEPAPKLHLMRNSPLGQFEAFAQVWAQAAAKYPDTYAPYAKADLAHYHQALLDWSDAGNKKKYDWLAAIRSSMRRDADNDRLRKAGTTHSLPASANASFSHSYRPTTGRRAAQATRPESAPIAEGLQIGEPLTGTLADL